MVQVRLIRGLTVDKLPKRLPGFLVRRQQKGGIRVHPECCRTVGRAVAGERAVPSRLTMDEHPGGMVPRHQSSSVEGKIQLAAPQVHVLAAGASVSGSRGD